MAKSLEEKARDKKPLVRSSVATDENAPLKLLELLSNDTDDMVRGDVATNESASEAILRKLSTDSDESVRCAVASNKTTPLDILATLLTDKSKYVKQNAKDNPNSKKIGKSQSADQKQTSLKPKKSESAKSKPINGEFSSQELTASVFTYTSAQFKKIKLYNNSLEYIIFISFFAVNVITFFHVRSSGSFFSNFAGSMIWYNFSFLFIYLKHFENILKKN